MNSFLKALSSIFRFFFTNSKKSSPTDDNQSKHSSEGAGVHSVQTDNSPSDSNEDIHSHVNLSDEGQTLTPTCSDTICLDAVNDDTMKPIIFVGKSTTIDVTLENSTGDNLPLKKGDSAPKFEIFFPEYFTDEEVGKMSIGLQNWEFTHGNGSLLLTYNGPDMDWKQGSFNSIKFQITSVLTNADPTTGTFQVNLTNFKGSQNIPVMITSTLTLSKMPKPGNAQLADVLDIILDNAGTVYISKNKKDALQNTLFLNIKNTGKEPLYKAEPGETDWPETPQVTVSFIYGTTSGALASNDDPSSPQIGSAWNIDAKVSISDGNTWNTENPNSSANALVWQLNPIKNPIKAQRLDILGVDVNSNITFSFSDIVSLTPIGHTNMTISFNSFYKDKDTPYDPFIIVLDINKINPPATRGIIDFFSPHPHLEIRNLQDPVFAHFRWSLFQVHKTRLSNLEFPSKIPPKEKIYSPDEPLQYVDNEKVELKDFDTSQNLTFNLEAFDGDLNPLNSKQFTIHLKSNFFVDPRDGQKYPTVVINGKTWMAHNMNFDTRGGNVPYSGFDINREDFGYLYNWQAAKEATPDGWHLPLDSEWEELINFFGDGKNAYAALIEGGSKGFNASLGGWGEFESGGNIKYQDKSPTGVGYYWSNSPSRSGTAFFTKFINELPGSQKVYKEVTTGNSFTTNNFFSCRYVKNS